MAGYSKSARNMTVTTSSGTNVVDSTVLDGTAKKSPVANAKNETVEYETPKADKGPLGGLNTNS